MMLLCSVAFAADTETKKGEGNFSVAITNNDENTGHSYKAYQIFDGDLVEKDGATVTGTGDKLKLSNIVWGSGVDGEAIVTELAGISDDSNPLKALGFTAGMTASQIADKLDKKADDSNIAQAFAEVVQNHLKTNAASGTGSATGVTGLKAGYYFIQDEGNMATDTEHAGALTRYILQVVHSVSITQKANTSKVDKFTKNKDDSATSSDYSTWKKTGDYDVGDTIPFMLTGTLPDNFAEYDYFKTYTFTDKLSAGLTAPAAADIKVYVYANKAALDADTAGTAGTDVTSHFATPTISGEATAEQTITIALASGEDLKTWASPALTKDSIFVVRYNAVLNNSAISGPTGNPNEVKLTFSNNPNADGQGDSDTTPPETVIIFTYDLKIDKVDQDKQPLSGAHFALYKKYTAEADIPAGKTAVTSVNYDEGRKTYTFEGNYWALVEEKTTGTEFDFLKIDVGEYVLVETETPNGYNSVAPYKFTVTSEINDAGKTLLKVNGKANGEVVDLGGLEATVKMDATEGSLNADVINNQGAQLPSTGGIGTTIFYVAGSLMVLAAAILLITKRRMGSND